MSSVISFTNYEQENVKYFDVDKKMRKRRDDKFELIELNCISSN